MRTREQLGSRLGFLLLSAGCAIGLGNVWRFPFITGRYGGAAFVLIYLIFLVMFGLPVMVMEFSVGRAAQRGIAQGIKQLEPKGSCWHLHGYAGLIGCYILLMFYTTVTGWLLAYCWYSASGQLAGLSPEAVAKFFASTLQDPVRMVGWMAAAVAACSLICAQGLQKGVERVTKFMMACLFLVMMALIVRCLTLPGAEKGLEFYLMPDFSKMRGQVGEVIFAAMGQSLFTLSLGIGSMAIFGSYIGKSRSLVGESLHILILDTMVALMAGLIIFPACFAFHVNADSGPGLIFVTLPNVFNSMTGGRLWGLLFFVFLSFAALTTVITVLENMIAFNIDGLGWSREKSAAVTGAALFLLSLPCALGFNLLSSIQPMGAGSHILDLEDFIVSNNLLPLGSLMFVLFCSWGWGWQNFLQEANSGRGPKFPLWLRRYVQYILPCILLIVFIQGYFDKFFN